MYISHLFFKYLDIATYRKIILYIAQNVCVRKIIFFLNKKEFCYCNHFQVRVSSNSHFHTICATDLIIKPRDNDRNRSQMEIDSILNLTFSI